MLVEQKERKKNLLPQTKQLNQRREKLRGVMNQVSSIESGSTSREQGGRGEPSWSLNMILKEIKSYWHK